jgi:hypothetical protein
MLITSIIPHFNPSLHHCTERRSSRWPHLPQPTPQMSSVTLYPCSAGILRGTEQGRDDHPICVESRAKQSSRLLFLCSTCCFFLSRFCSHLPILCTALVTSGHTLTMGLLYTFGIALFAAIGTFLFGFDTGIATTSKSITLSFPLLHD